MLHTIIFPLVGIAMLLFKFIDLIANVFLIVCNSEIFICLLAMSIQWKLLNVITVNVISHLLLSDFTVPIPVYY
jgi:hypothetical protein